VGVEWPHQLVAIREVYAQIEPQYPTLPVNPHHFELWRQERSVRA
jgi:hypothetical protein